MARVIERLGMRFKNNQGCIFEIIEYNSCKDLKIRFIDEFSYETNATFQQCEKGEILNPFFKSNCGVGYLGLDKNGHKIRTGGKNSRAYTVWSDMIRRCYSGASYYASYADCIVCDRWKCFANFLEDLPLIEGYDLWYNNPNKGISLDKDIKGDSKEYCKEKCKFVTLEENTQERMQRKGNPIKKKKLKATNIETQECIIFNSTLEAEKSGFNRGRIYVSIKQGQTHKGYKWEYIED